MDNQFSYLMTAKEGKSLHLSKESIWKWNQIVLREKYKDTPAGYISEEEKKQEIEAWKEDVEKEKRLSSYELIKKEIPRQEILIGREKELLKLQEIFHSDLKPKIVLLSGMGGIGKTALALSYAEYYEAKYEKILFIRYRGSLIETFSDDEQIGITNLSWSQDRYRNQAEYMKLKWKIFCEIVSNEKTLLILDNMDNENDKNLSLFEELHCDILITSRCQLKIDSIQTIFVESISSEKDWVEFYKSYGKKEYRRKEIKQLDIYREKVSGNPLLMEIALSSSELQTQISQGRWNYFLPSRALKKTEIQALRYLTILPLEGMKKEKFLKCSKIKEKVMERLITMSLVKEVKESYQLHPVIAESIECAYPATQENCKTFLHGLFLEYTNIWNAPYHKVTKAVPVCLEILKKWEHKKAWLAQEYDAFATVLWIGGYFNESLNSMKELYEECENYYGKIHQITGFVSLRVAAVYHNSMRFEQARGWYENAYDILNACQPYNGFYELWRMQAIHKLARMARSDGENEKALKLLKECEIAMDKFIEDNPDTPLYNHRKKYIIALEKAKVYFQEGKNEQVLEICKSLEKKYSKEENANEQYFLVELKSMQSRAYLTMGNSKKAEKLADYCVKKSKKMRGKTSKETLGCQEIQADVWNVERKYDQAQESYQRILDALERYYPYQVEWYQRIVEKQKKNWRKG